MDSAYERGGDARRKIWIKPPKETDLGVAQAFFDPKKKPKTCKYQIYIFNTFLRAVLHETFMAKCDGILPTQS